MSSEATSLTKYLTSEQRPEVSGVLRRAEHRRVFAVAVLSCVLAAAVMASWLPLQVSIITVFLFAGPHNWFELRYFLMRLPARFGKSRNFFVVAFAGIGLLTAAYVSLPALYYMNVWSGASWPGAIATWNTLMLLWIGALGVMRAR